MNEFLQRLKQRKLVQWALAYVAGAFALLQGIDIIAQQFGWPEVLQRGITLALVVGFFVALLLAWYHGERGAQRVSGPELLILALILVSGGAALAICRHREKIRGASSGPDDGCIGGGLRPAPAGGGHSTEVDRGSSLRESERGKGERLLRRGHPGRNPHAPGAQSHLAYLDDALRQPAR